jgi:prepilin-type N-terminal cleavage/methylation domain-containing protein/prepilin-type processing-associated H-X9-DG protein
MDRSGSFVMMLLENLSRPFAIPSTPALPARRTSPDRGFTLVELLVVIGIIALLIAFLMPSLGVARQAAQRVSCSAKLQQMMIAAQNHQIDHKGFYPLVGVMPGLQPPDFYDNDATKYDYLSYQFAGCTRMLAPITLSLASEMTYGRSLLVQSNDAIGVAETDDAGFIRNFICPGQASSVSDLNMIEHQQPPLLYIGVEPSLGEIVWYTEAQSYIFNEAVLGWGQQQDDLSGRLRGRTSQIRQASLTMFAADGLAGSIYDRTDLPYPTGVPMLTVYNALNPGTGTSMSSSMTLADALEQDGLAGDNANFDMNRHHGKINIAFCDGHVETRFITPADLSHVFLLAP